jgi:hypothetical protein
MSQTDDSPTKPSMQLLTENTAFSPEELAACSKCGRKNPPTRLSCVYCGGAVDLPESERADARPTFRRPEDWEKGFSIIVVSACDADPAAVARASGAESELAGRLLSQGKPLPLTRIASRAESDAIVERLASLGVTAIVASDVELDAENAPRRLRRIGFDGDGLQFVPFGDESEFRAAADDLVLIVTGALYRRRVESTEKRKKGESKILDAVETASDEPVVDLYFRDDAAGYRISSSGFDFSGLGAEKAIVAAENLKLIVARLQEAAPQARLDDGYLPARDLVGAVWQTEVRKDSFGMKRSSFGKFDLASVSTSSNLVQFNRYSRLQRLLI